MQTKGFTLIELLIVIGIIAILATAVLLVINPAQILSETRDTQRLSDLDTVKAAINLASYNDSTLVFGAGPGCSVVLLAIPNPFDVDCSAASGRAVDGTGWVKVNFGSSPSVATLPLDPTNTANYSYHYKGSGGTNGTFEVDGRLESAKHRAKMVDDGGNKNTCTSTFVEDDCWYEVGTKLNQA